MVSRGTRGAPRRAALTAVAAAAVAALLSGCPRAPKAPVGPPPPRGMGKDADPVELELETIDRVPTRLSALRGRVTVLTFFTTGSDDALILSSVLNVVYADFTPYGVRVVAVALDRFPELVSAYVEGAALAYPVYVATEPVRAGATTLGPILAVPLTLVLDGAGRARFHHYGLVEAKVLAAEIDALRSGP